MSTSVVELEGASQVAVSDARPPLEFAVLAVVHAQRELAEFVASLSDDDYTQQPVGVFTSSIGGHVRHCLDHVEALLSALRTGWLDYDARERGTNIETDRTAALAKIDKDERELRILLDVCAERRFILSTVVCPSTPRVETTTTLSRELAFCLSHTVHHCALLSAMGAILGVRTSESFGYAPATLAWMERTACAR